MRPGSRSGLDRAHLDAAGQAPVADGVRSGTLAMSASRPGGSVTLSPESSWSVSLREIDTANGLNARPRCWSTRGERGVETVTQLELIPNESVGPAAAPPFQGLNDDVAVNVPQFCRRGQRGPGSTEEVQLEVAERELGLYRTSSPAARWRGWGRRGGSLMSTPSDSAAT